MRVSCPACDAAYEIPDDVLTVGGRRLRCARCAHEWTAEAGGAASSPVSLPVPAPPSPRAAPQAEAVAQTSPSATLEREAAALEPGERGAEEHGLPVRPAARLVASPPLVQDRADPIDEADGSKGTVFAWAVSVLVLAVIGTAGYVFRDTVQSVWPPSQIVYAALGLG